MVLNKCTKCKTYTLKDKCPKCKSKTAQPTYKFKLSWFGKKEKD